MTSSGQVLTYLALVLSGLALIVSVAVYRIRPAGAPSPVPPPGPPRSPSRWLWPPSPARGCSPTAGIPR